MTWDRAVREFRAELQGLYGPRLKGLILYGSHARGEGDSDSDIDLLVILDDFEDFWHEFKLISKMAGALSLQHDVVIAALPIREEDFQRGSSPIILNIKREGIPAE